MITTERLMPVFTSTARYASRRPVAPQDALPQLLSAAVDMAETYQGKATLSFAALSAAFAARVLLHQLASHHDDKVPSYAVGDLAAALDALLFPSEAVAEPALEPSNVREVDEAA